MVKNNIKNAGWNDSSDNPINNIIYLFFKWREVITMRVGKRTSYIIKPSFFNRKRRKVITARAGLASRRGGE